MALMKKQDPNKKKELSKKETGIKETPKKAVVVSKDKKSIVKKDSGKVTAKREKVNRVEQVKSFSRGVWNELKKVHWLNKREVIIYTGVVLVAVVFVGSLIWLFDLGLSAVLKTVLHR